MSIKSKIFPPRTGDEKEVQKFYENICRHFSHHEYAGDPTGNIKPRWAGDWCHDTTNDDWYISHGTAAANWKIAAT